MDKILVMNTAYGMDYVMDNASLKDALGESFMDGRYTVQTFDKDAFIDEPSHEAMFNELGQDAYMFHESGLFYNLCVNMVLRLKKFYDGKGKALQAQDESDTVIAIYDLACHNLKSESGVLCWDDFKYFLYNIADTIYANITYQVHRVYMEDSIDAIMSNREGARVNFLSQDEMLRRRIERGDNAQTKSDKELAKTQEVIDKYKEGALRALPNEYERQLFTQLIAKRLDNKQVLTSTERSTLSRLRRTINATIHGETVEQNKVNNAKRKAQAQERAQHDKAVKEASKSANREQRFNDRKESFLRALAKAQMDIEANLKIATDATKCESLQALRQDLIELATKVTGYQRAEKEDDRALQPFRNEFKLITDELLATSPIKAQKAKSIRKNIREQLKA